MATTMVITMIEWIDCLLEALQIEADSLLV